MALGTLFLSDLLFLLLEARLLRALWAYSYSPTSPRTRAGFSPHPFSWLIVYQRPELVFSGGTLHVFATVCINSLSGCFLALQLNNELKARLKQFRS